MNLIYRPIDTWPGQLTAERQHSQFSASWSDTKLLLDREVSFLCGDRRQQWHHPVIIQLAVPESAIRQDGQMRQGAKGPEHPGVIVTIPDATAGSLRFSCDRFIDSYRLELGTRDAWQHNVRAIALGLEALRKVERYGLGRGTEQYVGFQALGSGTPMPAAPESPLTVDQAIALLHEHATPGIDWDWDDPAAVGVAYRSAAKAHHPDAGGDPALFRRLTEARDLLEASA